MMAPNAGGDPTGDIAGAITETFGSFGAFKEQFKAAGVARCGSGWAWLVLDGGTLAVTSTPNQDSPLSAGKTPLLGNDVWEHAYYLKYQNKRPAYLAAWWNTVDWSEISRRYAAAIG
jgi:Fe-Mn family superoxide dismutase